MYIYFIKLFEVYKKNNFNNQIFKYNILEILKVIIKLYFGYNIFFNLYF
jgi:hypothetical protein